MKKYKYKNIVCFQTWGTWQADYNNGEKRFALHRLCCKTKKQAYKYAKEEVDFLNER